MAVESESYIHSEIFRFPKTNIARKEARQVRALAKIVEEEFNSRVQGENAFELFFLVKYADGLASLYIHSEIIGDKRKRRINEYCVRYLGSAPPFIDLSFPMEFELVVEHPCPEDYEESFSSVFNGSFEAFQRVEENTQITDAQDVMRGKTLFSEQEKKEMEAIHRNNQRLSAYAHIQPQEQYYPKQKIAAALSMLAVAAAVTAVFTLVLHIHIALSLVLAFTIAILVVLSVALLVEKHSRYIEKKNKNAALSAKGKEEENEIESESEEGAADLTRPESSFTERLPGCFGGLMKKLGWFSPSNDERPTRTTPISGYDGDAPHPSTRWV